MKKTGKMGIAFMLAAMLTASTVSAESGLSIFGEIGEESNQITAPQSALTSSGDIVALDDLGISIVASDYTAIRQSDGFVYIYTAEDDSIPYVIIGRYDSASDDFADAFTVYMSGCYEDLRVVEEAAPTVINGNTFSRIVYEYTVSGYTVTDTRLFLGWNGSTYMFGSKEIPELNYLVGTGYLEQVAGGFAPLAGGDSDYDKHVDSSRSVTGQSMPITDLGGLGDNVLERDSDDASEGKDTVGGNAGSVGGIADNTQIEEAAGSITFDESVANFTGTWVEFQDGFKLYLPTNWTQYPITDEQKNAGALYLAYDASLESSPYIEVDWADSQGYTTLDELAADLTAAGYSVDDKVLVNGIECISYSNTTDNMSGLMFFHPQSTDYVFVVIAGSYSADVDTLAAILCSLSPNN